MRRKLSLLSMAFLLMRSNHGSFTTSFITENSMYLYGNHFLTGMFAARKVEKMRHGKTILDTVLTLPMILPPTVVGFFLLLLFGNSSPLGIWLSGHGMPVVFSFAGTVAAAVVVSFPLMYRTARSAFEQMDKNLIYAGETLGLSDYKIFGKLFFRIVFRVLQAEQFWHLRGL